MKSWNQKAKRVPLRTFIDGQYWGPHFTADNIRSAKAMIPRPDDVFICTYPKSGTTWIQHIVHQLMGKAEYEMEDEGNGNVGQQFPIAAESEIKKKALWSISPMIERMGAVYTDQFESPRILKSNFTYTDMPKGGGAKYIYCCRNPKDVLNSYYHHHKMFQALEFEQGRFDVFFDLFMDGKVAFGDYFDHLLSWLDGIEKKEENILLLKYEDLVTDLHSAIVQIGNFLGGKAAGTIKDKEKVDQVAFGDYFDHLLSWLDGIEKKEENILLLKYEDLVTDLHSAIVQIGNFLGGKAAGTIKDKEKVDQIVAASTISSMKKNQERWLPSSSSIRGEFIRKGGSRDWKNLFSHEQSNAMDLRFGERCSGTVTAEWRQAEMEWDALRLLI